jgi:isoleucyl-tRNA synthetase
MSDKIEYKSTINLPKTAFPMKADLPVREPKIIEFWEKIGLYSQIRSISKGRDKFILHDGPPYANGDIHIGHALNKILKDIIVRYKTMRGFDAPFIPGWDCHGLPVEHQLFKEIGKTKYDIERVDFRKKAYEYAIRFVDIQRKQFERLGIAGDWKNPYLTLSKSYEADIVRSFAILVKNNYIYKSLKPINWCITCETALAEAEIEYFEHTSRSIYVKFRIKDERVKSDKTFLIIWTTTPWTLVSNVAVAVHPDLLYVSVKVGDETFYLAENLLTILTDKLNFKNYKLLDTFKGKDLEGLNYSHPFIDREGKVVLADYVSNAEGTGCVHTAPGHGQEDFLTGCKYKLQTIMPVDEKGRFDETTGEFRGINIFEANNSIIKNLSKKGSLLYSGEINHSYPHCWRCKNPVITRATVQWFMDVDKHNLRHRLLNIIKDLKWIPASGENRISSMIEERPDWCLSRQRYWGVPIVAFYCKDCKHVLLDYKLIQSISLLIEKEGSDVWFTKDIKELIPEGYACPSCKGKNFQKEQDIIDVWFDSGISHQAVLAKNESLKFPADLYLEGSDQHRGWFQAAIITSMGICEKAPFKAVLTHGFVVDGEGRKMSKSLGNVISPQEVIKEFGADVLRLWVSACNYNEDIRISKEVLSRTAESYRKIRNTLKFILGNLYDFKPEEDIIDYSDMLEIDKWALYVTENLLKEITSGYENFEFHKVVHLVYNFCVLEMSNVYLDIIKDRLYIFPKASIGRRSCQSALFRILDVTIKVLSPIFPFTMEEVFAHINKKSESESVHTQPWPVPNSAFLKYPHKEKWDRLFKIRALVMKALESKRSQKEIGDSLEAGIEIFSNDFKMLEFLKGFDDLKSIFLVSEVNLHSTENLDGEYTLKDEEIKLGVAVRKAKGNKCLRCWNYSETVGNNNKFTLLCSRCASILEETDIHGDV